MDEALVLEERLPVAVQALAAAPDDAALAGMNEANDGFLRALFVLQEAPEFDEHDAVQAELRRLDLKLNLLLSLVGDLLAQQGRQPDSVPLRLTPDDIRCPAPNLPAHAHHVLVSLYLNTVIPRPLQLPGVVSSLEEGTARVRFTGLSQAVTDALEKFIFRQHRKAVAQSRVGR